MPASYRSQSPVEEVAHVGQDLNGLPSAAVESGERIWSAIESAGGAVSQRCDGVAEEFAFVFHVGKYSARRRIVAAHLGIAAGLGFRGLLC